MAIQRPPRRASGRSAQESRRLSEAGSPRRFAPREDGGPTLGVTVARKFSRKGLKRLNPRPTFAAPAGATPRSSRPPPPSGRGGPGRLRRASRPSPVARNCQATHRRPRPEERRRRRRVSKDAPATRRRNLERPSRRLLRRLLRTRAVLRRPPWELRTPGKTAASY